MPGGSFSTRRLTEYFDESRDALANDVVRNVRSEIDIAAHYPATTERIEIHRNGSRVFPQYNSISQFRDEPDHWVLAPDAGDEMHIQSSDTGTYVVNYLMQSSFALTVNQELQDGDVFEFGVYNHHPNKNGWLFRQRGADHAPDEGDIIAVSAGTETTLETDVKLQRAITGWYRYEIEFGWYAVLNQKWSQTYTEDGTVKNFKFATTSQDGKRGPETGNLSLYVGIEASDTTTGLELEAGSMSQVVFGASRTLTRSKKQFESIELTGSTNTWEPFYAVRIDPDQVNVNVGFSELEVVNYGANANLEVIVHAFDENKTDITNSDWGEPTYGNSFNTAIQTTTNVTEVPNQNGTQTDLGSNEKPGGHLLAAAVDVDGGGAEGQTATVNDGTIEKKRIHNTDHIVFLGRSGTINADIDFAWNALQDW